MPTEDYKLWETWKTTPSKTNLEPLLNYFDPIIMKRVNMFAGADIPKPALETKGKVLAVEAFKTYNPKKDTALGTHVFTHLKRLSRYTGELQNVGKIPENRRLKIQQFKNTKADMEEELGREPNAAELADMLMWPLQEVSRIEAELRSSTASSTFEGDRLIDKTQSKMQRIIKNIYYELGPEEKLIYEYLLGEGGKQRLNESQIAKKLNMSITKVSRVKHGIVEKIKQWE